MATSSISNAVGAANSKMAEAIRKQKEREAAAKMRGGRDTSAREELAERNRKRSKSSQRKPPKALSNRWSMRADFSLPSPLTNRPTGDAGGVSFHFSVTKISKESSPTLKGEPMAGYQNPKSPGSDHELYITRDGAAEGIAAAHEAYLLRTDAPEVSCDSLATSSDGEVKHDDIDEKIEGGGAGQTLSIFSNISDSESDSKLFCMIS